VRLGSAARQCGSAVRLDGAEIDCAAAPFGVPTLRVPHPMRKILLILLCFVLPFLAVLIHEGPTRRVLWAILWQILGHIPGVVYGIYVVTQDRPVTQYR
jgi:uncharacterized membrane protein YqaE (UPF0057 family)